MTSIEARTNPLFLRNSFPSDNEWGIPLIEKQTLQEEDLNLISFTDTRSNASRRDKNCGVHFFIDDYHMRSVYNTPDKSLEKLRQYKFLLTPDYSLYANMPTWLMLENIAHKQWVGAFWQSKGLIVYPTISWGLAYTFEFCFCGVRKNSTVAISTIGCKHSKASFMRGYNEMLRRLEPENIILLGTPFDDMKGNIIQVDYIKSRQEVDRYGR